MFDKLKKLMSGSGSSSTPATARGGSVNRKPVMVGVLLALSVLAMVLMFTFEGTEARKNKLYISIAFELQVISQQIAVNALEAAAGREQAFERIAQNQNRFLGNLETYNNGDRAQNLPALPLEY